jgi:hypothetical protein
MNHSITVTPVAAALLCVSISLPAAAAPTPFFFSTGNPDGKIATLSRTASTGKL